LKILIEKKRSPAWTDENHLD